MGHKNLERDLIHPEVFVGIEVFVDISQPYNDFEEFVGPGAASAIWSDQIVEIRLKTQRNSFSSAGLSRPRSFCTSEVFVDQTAPSNVFVRLCPIPNFH